MARCPGNLGLSLSGEEARTFAVQLGSEKGEGGEACLEHVLGAGNHPQTSVVSFWPVCFEMILSRVEEEEEDPVFIGVTE